LDTGDVGFFADQVRTQLRGLASGSRLPSAAELAELVNTDTAHADAACAVLVRLGWVEHDGEGWYVRA